MPGYNVRVRRPASGTANALALESERSTTTGEWRSPGEVIFDGAWYHVGAVYDSSNVTNAPQFYINGVSQTTTVRTTPVGTQRSNIGPGYIGNVAALDRSWDGRIDEFRLYNRLLTASEMQLLAQGAPTNLAPVVEAGPDQLVTMSSQVFVNGVVTDDGRPNPPGEPARLWSKLSGPGTVEFADELSETSQVTFSAAGVYVLRLTADDGQAKIVDDIAFTVIDPPTVSIRTSTNVVAEFGQLPFALVSLVRGGSTSSAVTVYYEFSGTASNGLDFGFVPTALTIPAGEQSNDFVIFGSPDELPEGDETIIVTLQPDPFYIIGSPGSITITLKDRPWDDWRFSHFTASELTNAAISGEQADPEADDLPNLLEYAFNFDPHSPDTARGFSGAVEFIPVTGMDHLVVTFTRRKPPTDISYQVEVSSDLRTWSSGPQVTQEMLPPIDDGNGITETARVRLLNSTEQDGYRFVRLKVAKLGRSSGGINGQP